MIDTSRLRTSLAGYAGSGKSTVAQVVHDIWKDSGLHVVVIAPTGKAAVVLRNKGIPATTIHRAIYMLKGKKVNDKGETELIFRANKRQGFADRLIVDEASMVDERMLLDIEEKGIPTLWCGDPGQLPPVKGVRTTLLTKPTYILEKIHRQAEGNPIIQFAHHVRKGGSIGTPLDGINHCALRGKSAKYLVAEMQSREVDRLLVRTNAQRTAINGEFRKSKGYDGIVAVGEQVICLQNNYEADVINGEIFVVESVKPDVRLAEMTLRNVDTGEQRIVDAYLPQFGRDRRVEDEEIEDLPPETCLFDYAYAITGHKSQGSSWKHVGVVALGPVSGEIQWNYTAITRAEQQLTIFC